MKPELAAQRRLHTRPIQQQPLDFRGLERLGADELDDEILTLVLNEVTRRAAELALAGGDTLKVPLIVLKRLYVLRNQLMHGGVVNVTAESKRGA